MLKNMIFSIQKYFALIRNIPSAQNDFVPENTPQNPCVPSLCGPNARCEVINGHASCACLSNYFGSPPNCRPECTINSDCISSKACIRNRCEDPCPGSCGFNAQCHVYNHVPICTCYDGYTGNAFSQCNPIPQISKFPSNPPVFYQLFLSKSLISNYSPRRRCSR